MRTRKRLGHRETRTAEIAKDGSERALPLPPGAMPKAAVSTDASKVQFSKEGALAAYYSLNESGFDRIAPTAAVNQGVEVIANSWI